MSNLTLMPRGISDNKECRSIRVYYKKKSWYFSYANDSRETAITNAVEFLNTLKNNSAFQLLDDAYGLYTKPTAANTTGVVGVAPDRKYGKLIGYSAHWRDGIPPNRKTRRKGFSFVRYGSKAFEEAVEYRRLKQESLKCDGVLK